ncbi:hypothetical protein AJ87_36165 [Rhizobium yanglingense]|nr:hypothetical protein AJ87_36165 [Rhizobium yanglingense]
MSYAHSYAGSPFLLFGEKLVAFIILFSATSIRSRILGRKACHRGSAIRRMRLASRSSRLENAQMWTISLMVPISE